MRLSLPPMRTDFIRAFRFDCVFTIICYFQKCKCDFIVNLHKFRPIGPISLTSSPPHSMCLQHFAKRNRVMSLSQHRNRFDGIKRDYGESDVDRLSGSLRIEYTLAREGAERLWKLLQERPFVRTLGALTGNQAMQQVKAGLEAIYLSGWQVAADANNAGQMYPDQSLYPSSSVPEVVRRINKTLQR